jgi:hypothetical protein
MQLINYIFIYELDIQDFHIEKPLNFNKSFSIYAKGLKFFLIALN